MTNPTYRTLGKSNPEAIAAQVRQVATVETLRAERDSARRERDALALRVMTLEAERDNAVAAKHAGSF